MTKLFGTDGVRGKANEHPITSEMTMKIGRAAALFFGNKNFLSGDKKAQVVIGKDTRVSGDMIECAVASGVCSAGADALLVGILPTPGIALIASQEKADAGIVISASHNPFEDNGIKVFDGQGLKLPDPVENGIEKLVFADFTPKKIVGKTIYLPDAAQKYAQFLESTLPKNTSLKNLRIVLDCGNGATHAVAPMVFTALGAEVIPLFINPDGININVDCGSQYPQALQKEVIKQNAAIGLAFDGDGDRLIAVDEKGNRITGDQVLAICARYLKEKNQLANNAVVSTVMSNLGLKQALGRMNIKHVIADVGDRYVLDAMKSTGAILGGEDSGHIIFLNHHTTGDGILSGIQLISAMLWAQKPISELSAIMEIFPQVLINVPVAAKPDIDGIAPIVQAIKNAENILKENGRVLVRYSGTRPVCRVMVEGPGMKQTQHLAGSIAEIIKKELTH